MRKSVRVLCVMLAVITALIGCSAVAEESTPTVDVKAVEETVRASQAEIMESAVTLANMAQYENNFWEALESVGGDVDYDRMVSEAYAWLLDKGGATQEEIVQAFTEISDQHDEILRAGANGESIEQYEKLYAAYDRLYHLSTAPSGSREQFVRDYNDILDQLESADSLLTSLVG